MKTETEINYMLMDPTAAADGALETTARHPWVHLDRLHDEDDTHVMRKYGTLEPNQFFLDGSYALFPDAPEQQDMGLWSAVMSDETGVFHEPPVLTVTFSKPHTSLGLTLIFSVPTGDWAREVHIKWYGQGGKLVAEHDFFPDSAAYFCDCLIHDYYGLEITFRATNKPRRWLKLFRLYYGLTEYLRGSSISEATILEETDPTSATISVNTLRFGFYADRRFDLLDLTGIYSVFQQQQRVRVRQRVDGVLREMGMFYTDTPSVEEQRIVSMECIDLTGVLDQTDFMGGLWLKGISAQSLLAQIMRSAGTSDYTLDAALADVVVRGYLPICTHREALQQLAFAIGAVVSCARSDKIRIYPMQTAAQSVITPHDKAVGHRQTQRKYVSGVEIYTHNYTVAADAQELFKADCTAGEQFVTFSGPAAGLACTGAEIIDSGINFAKLRVAQAGEVRLTGRMYDDQLSLGGSVYAEVMPAAARANVKVIEDCTLAADAQATAQRVYAYYQNRIEDDGALFPVAACAGQTVSVQTIGGRTLTGMVESMEIDLTGGGISNAIIVGR